MFKRVKLLALTAVVATAPAFAAPLAGTVYEQAQIDMEIQSCLAEVGDRADYEGAVRVRHEVSVAPRRSIGHQIDIRTSVFAEGGDRAIRAYAARCLVYRDHKPVRFVISEADAGA